MSFTTIPIRELVEQAVQGRLDIPEFQRDFVWRPDQVRSLVDSLYRDYPIGQILTWTNPSYTAPRGPSVRRWLAIPFPSSSPVIASWPREARSAAIPRRGQRTHRFRRPAG